ncbi:Pimeloyl-ACP methyl ester carboxylesterase [Seinonella peptonophila]|uniref:Pimeloyl-ACP methyl ester carboxylesterase n=1 Tax=Seinonella peptonophila TaxID=112248 RepID=A0A1M4U1A3_9BACL|nr:alpha/beta fold hydrolase [Seinonella peptonophila]SHE50397.1 Pimeloyl-ACP methyl ester carboxylesterase [Seinonella peptonophila]
METFVLVHGACHTGESWREVTRILEAKGHRVYTPTAGGNQPGADKQVTLQQVYQPIVDLIEKKDLHDVILLGHSLGGTTIQFVAQAIPQRIKRLVFMGALVLEDQKPILETFPELQVFFETSEIDEEKGTILFSFPIWREVFMNDVDLQTAQRIYKQLTPNPINYIMDKVDLQKFYTLQISKSYLHGTEDAIVPYRIYEKTAKLLGIHRFVQYEGSHEIMYSNPQEIAKKILVAGRD